MNKSELRRRIKRELDEMETRYQENVKANRNTTVLWVKMDTLTDVLNWMKER